MLPLSGHEVFQIGFGCVGKMTFELPPMVCTALDTVETLMRRAQAINRLTEAQQDRLATALQTARDALVG